MNDRSSTLVLLAVLLLGSCGAALAGIEEQQETIAMAWIEAHNSNDDEVMAAFRAKHLKRSDVADWRSGFREMCSELGRLEPYAVMIEEAGQLRVGVRSERREERVRLTFRFHHDAPDQILEIGMDIGVGGGPGGGGNPLPPLELDGNAARRKDQIDAYLRELAAQELFSGAVIVADPDGVRFEGAYGLASREFEVPNGLETRFDVGSCTKDFTRVAILQLAAKGKLSLDDTVGRHLPDYPNSEVRSRVTIRQLLEHRSGLGDYFTEEWSQTPMGRLRHIEDYIPIWGPKPLEYEPGTRQQYSNYGYTVLGAIIEQLSGRRYPDYIVEHLFEPAGMSRSGFFETDAIVPDVAIGYTRMSPTGERGDELSKNVYLEPAKGGPWGKSYSTVGDLYRFYAGMLDGRIPAGGANWLAGRWSGGGFALAGGGPGLNAMAMLENGRLVVVLANMDPPIAGQVASRIHQALDR